MPVTDKLIDQAYSDLKAQCGGVRNDYFGLLYLEDEHDVPRAKAVNQVAWGGNDYGLDGFHFDPARKNLYLFQFKWSPSPQAFKDSLHRLIDIGMDRVFLSGHKDEGKNQLLLQLRAALVENRAAVEQVYFRFVFTGDPEEAERSSVLDKLREDLEDKKYLIDQFFGRPVTLVVEFRSAAGKVGAVADHKVTREYTLPVAGLISRPGPGGETMHAGFVRLLDLHDMHRDMGPRFFERNIRFGLGGEGSVNRVLKRAFKEVLDGKQDPGGFAFHHNGITLSAEQVADLDGRVRITSPRLLNGAQTVTTLDEFLKAHADNPQLKEGRAALEELRVLCRIVSGAKLEFVTAVTINNNRQNPVEPWNLHANDLIQLELEDLLRTQLGIFYERQENAFAGLSSDDLDEAGITEWKAIELTRLAQTYLASDGQIDRMSRLRDVFEDEKAYAQVFGPARLKADLRHVVLCYKVQFRLRKLVNEILAKGPNKYAYIGFARNLLWAFLCQALLNDPDLETYADGYGRGMSVEADFTEVLRKLAITRCSKLLSDVTADPAYADKVAEGNFRFLRTNTAFQKGMDRAYKHWKWVEKHLR
jgi:hypothetical protein